MCVRNEAIGSARFEFLTNCQVFLGPCGTSVYLESCTNCIFFVWCHQLRIHTTNNSDLYVYVNSHPIIEDCSQLRFAPYALEYEGLSADILVSPAAPFSFHLTFHLENTIGDFSELEQCC
jgi:hypothetical protein